MRSAPANSAAAIVCTGASPQRCFAHKARLGTFDSHRGVRVREGKDAPRSKSRRGDRDGRSTPYRPLRAKSPCRQSQSCYRLFLHRAVINDHSGP